MTRRIFPILALAVLLTASCSGRRDSAQAEPSAGETAYEEAAAEIQQPEYDSYFTGERLRLDFTLAGNDKDQSAYLDEIHRESEWAGPRGSLIEPFDYGQYNISVSADGKIIFSKGFSTLFEEWRTTPEASQVSRAASQCIWMPFPKQKVHIILSQRIRATGRMEPMLEFDVDPEDRHIIPGPENRYRIVPLQIYGDACDKVDIVIAAEAYTSSQMAKFRRDAQKLTDYFFSMEPYASRREDFNVWMVESPSQDGGADIPQEGLWRSTVMDSGFDTFYEDRYLTVWNHKKIAAAVSGAVFDAIIVLANETKYGGSGIYNSFAMATSDHKMSGPVFIHEFGHSFAGLADEYYDSSTAYENYYPEGVEPWEPNITTMVDFGSKWADMIADGTPVPTPADSSHTGIVGAYEGAGYMAKGCWRPYVECRMLNNTAPGFCPVCQRSINRMIDYYIGK
ncbi:MAG: IgA Peptidase M64 [Bacteroidales bacterium]|nr:IgA Peptidase M64 [Bacteroidales bacterium]